MSFIILYTISIKFNLEFRMYVGFLLLPAKALQVYSINKRLKKVFLNFYSAATNSQTHIEMQENYTYDMCHSPVNLNSKQ